MAELDWTDMPIHQSILTDWKTPEILIEGSLNCAKTTLALDKEITALLSLLAETVGGGASVHALAVMR